MLTPRIARNRVFKKVDQNKRDVDVAHSYEEIYRPGLTNHYMLVGRIDEIHPLVCYGLR